MKKTYINPKMEIVKLQTMQMLAASAQVYGNYDESTMTDLGRSNDGDDW